MSIFEFRAPAPPLYRLVVPRVDPGELGLVLTVEGMEWDGSYQCWVLTAANGHRYRLPRGLHDWGKQFVSGVRQQAVVLPAVLAFAHHQPGGMAVKILSAVPNRPEGEPWRG